MFQCCGISGDSTSKLTFKDPSADAVEDYDYDAEAAEHYDYDAEVGETAVAAEEHHDDDAGADETEEAGIKSWLAFL